MRHPFFPWKPLLLIPLLAACTGGGGTAADTGTGTDSGRDAGPSGATVARGQYLVDHVLVCAECHTPSLPDGSPDPSLYLAGSRSYDFQYMADGGIEVVSVYAENLTSDDVEGIGGWTDDQVRGAITHGIDDQNIALWPIMPYPEYSQMTADDVDSIVMYLRTVPASSNTVAPDTLPDPSPPAQPIDGTRIPQTTLASGDPAYASAQRGRYLATIACVQCHTPQIAPGIPDLSLAFAGGRMYQSRSDATAATSSNITPDATGLAGWSVADIVAAIRTNTERGTGRTLCPTMPGGHGREGDMTDADLNDIATYIHSLPPIAHGPFTCH